MKIIGKWSLYVAVFVVLIILIFKKLTRSPADINFNMDEKKHLVIFNKLNDTIYITAKAFGISGNSDEIVFSTSPISSKSRFIFYTSDIFFKKTADDSLIIYTLESSIPPDFDYKLNNIKVRLVKLIDYDEIQELSNNYQKYGLSKVTTSQK